MSCWRACTFNVENYDKDLVKDTFKRMGYSIDETSRNIRGIKICDGQLIRGDERLPLGIKWDNGNGMPVIEGDFYDSGFDSREFMTQLTCEYNLQLQIAAAEAAGYTIDESTYNVLEDGSVEIEAYAYA